jgi:hypothetical protein
MPIPIFVIGGSNRLWLTRRTKPEERQVIRSLRAVKHYLRTLHGDGMGIETTEWQLRAELDTWLHAETSIRTPHFHVTTIKCVRLAWL